MREALILGAARSPRSRGKRDQGALSPLHPPERLAQALGQGVEKSGVAKLDVEDVVMGCASSPC